MGVTKQIEIERQRWLDQEHPGVETIDDQEGPVCPYCGEQAQLRSSAEVYGGRDYGLIYLCPSYPQCDSYVGVHKGTSIPLGRMANKELRDWKRKAHAAFDPLWQAKMRLTGMSKKGSRSRAYQWLSVQLEISFDACHIGMFDVDMCKRVVEICMALPRKKP